MIQKQCFTLEWIDKVAKEHKIPDKNLVEKVIRALSLLELLVTKNCPFVFKGGTALMLLLGNTKRLSIDIDIICPPNTKIEDYLTEYRKYGFTDMQLTERKSRINVPKSHSKFFYQIAYQTNEETSYILLDVLYEEVHYETIIQQEINSPFIVLDGKPLLVNTPNIAEILGDKLTAFAPNTTGIPYQKNGKSSTMEIIKQLYDTASLFDKIDSLTSTKNSFEKFAKVELSYRSLADCSTDAVLDDIFQTALCIASKGTLGQGNFKELQDGIKRIRNFIFSEKYTLESAILNASKVAYLATLLKSNSEKIVHFDGNSSEMKEWNIQYLPLNKLNKLKKSSIEAFFYWYKTSQLMED